MNFVSSIKEVKEIVANRFGESPLGKLSEGKTLDKPMSDYDKPLGLIDENVKNCSIEEENAHWKDEIREETGWSEEIIDSITSREEYEIYKKAGLREVEINGKKCLIRDDIDLKQKDEDGVSNAERMERGLPPLTKDGQRVELHHIGQRSDAPLAELTVDEHRGGKNDAILHDKTKESEIDRYQFANERGKHWKERVRFDEDGRQ